MKQKPHEAVYACPCPQGYHALDLRNPLARALHRIMEQAGEEVTVIVRGKGSWRVPRIYIAIHGITGNEMEEQGFPPSGISTMEPN